MASARELGRRPQEMIRPHVERLIGEWMEEPLAGADDDGRYLVRVNTSGFIVEIVDFEPALVRLWSPVVVRVEKSIGLLEMLNGLNANGLGLRIYHTDDQVILATELVAETLDAGDVHFACHLLASAAERLGPELSALYGGETLFTTRDGLPHHLDDRAVSSQLN
ncbi:MAG TPA: YbjN domain-containing protein [Acidimicrobiia bacterium]|nr:YbjN domain-containing protein [Acidimicrobiia bacterium]